MIRVDGVGKQYVVRRGWRATIRHPFERPLATALENIHLSVGAGELFGLLGPNGAGKTTLFRILSTLLLPDSGTATVAGLDVTTQADAVRRVLTPVIADERSLNWRLTAQENLDLYAVLMEVPSAERTSRVRALLEQVGLHDTGTKLTGAFSSGMRQRLLIARALLARPTVLLLDEPTRSLDPISARTLRQFLREELVERTGCTVLLATHSAEEAFGLCDRVAILNRGRLLAAGSAEALAREYADERYTVWTTTPRHPVFAQLAARGLATQLQVLPQEDEGWTGVELSIRGGFAAGARVLEVLAAAGVAVGRFERAPLNLADLLERVVASETRGRVAPDGAGERAHG